MQLGSMAADDIIVTNMVLDQLPLSKGLTLAMIQLSSI